MSIGPYSATLAKIQARFQRPPKASVARPRSAQDVLEVLDGPKVKGPARSGLRAAWRANAQATPLVPGFVQCAREIPEYFGILENYAGGQGVSRPTQRIRKAVVLSLLMPPAAVADAAAFVAYPARVIAHAVKNPQHSKQ